MIKIPFMDVRQGQEDLRGPIGAAVARVMSSGVYILGPELDGFEREFSSYCGAQHCIGVSSGYDALYLILRGYNIGPGDEVIVPAHCFISLWFTVSAVGAVPIPVEPDPRTLNIDPAKIVEKINSRTKAIVALHIYGQPADMTPLLDVARARGVKVIEDMSQAHGAYYRGRRVGSWGDAAAVDFYPTLNLGAAGDGGAVVTSDNALAERVRSLRNFGAKGKVFGLEIGITSRLGELQASVLRIKLQHLDVWNEIRRKQAVVYQTALEKAPGVIRPEVLNFEGADHVWHRYVIRHPQRDVLARALHTAGIQTMVHYPDPPHFAPPYLRATPGVGGYPITEKMCREVLSLPIGPHLTVPQILQVAQAVSREAHLLQGQNPDPAQVSLSNPKPPAQEVPAPSVPPSLAGIPLPKPPVVNTPDQADNIR
ncbi:MAG: DegT/DnrJ/EryC1/StrS family aminotransferase [Elusimicrobia bacterium]|nr:DegT/DnrJ/EryC1/StrS family aminotransferase [Elusimicrobiota bacterium]